MTNQYKAVADYALNELNRNNTFQNSDVVTFDHKRLKFMFGFYTRVVETGGAAGSWPFLVFMGRPNTQGVGWRVLWQSNTIVKNDLGMGMDDADLDRETYMWYVADRCNDALEAFLEEYELDFDESDLQEWQKVLYLLRSVTVDENNKLHFDTEL